MRNLQVKPRPEGSNRKIPPRIKMPVFSSCSRIRGLARRGPIERAYLARGKPSPFQIKTESPAAASSAPPPFPIPTSRSPEPGGRGMEAVWGRALAAGPGRGGVGGGAGARGGAGAGGRGVGVPGHVGDARARGLLHERRQLRRRQAAAARPRTAVQVGAHARRGYRRRQGRGGSGARRRGVPAGARADPHVQ